MNKKKIAGIIVACTIAIIIAIVIAIPTTPKVLFSDDFSDETGPWDIYSLEWGSVSYKNGWLHLVNYTELEEEVATTSYAYQHFTDFILEVETKFVGGTDVNWHQVFCRWQDEYNYYDFGITADGYYLIEKYVGGNQIFLSGSTPRYSFYINQGVGAINLIHIECIGNKLSLSANGQVLTTVTDTSFTGGDISLGASSLEGSFTEIAFDNIMVTMP